MHSEALCLHMQLFGLFLQRGILHWCILVLSCHHLRATSWWWKHHLWFSEAKTEGNPILWRSITWHVHTCCLWKKRCLNTQTLHKSTSCYSKGEKMSKMGNSHQHAHIFITYLVHISHCSTVCHFCMQSDQYCCFQREDGLQIFLALACCIPQWHQWWCHFLWSIPIAHTRRGILHKSRLH